VAIHAVFAGSAYKALLDAGAEKVITCNSIAHISNRIDLSEAIAQGYLTLKRGR
jgi:ribose-phosphate pyrophosphokinase